MTPAVQPSQATTVQGAVQGTGPTAPTSEPASTPLDGAEAYLLASVAALPTDLYSDEPPLETKFHLQQIIILLSCLEWLWKDRDDFFAAANMTVYYNSKKIKTRDFRGPDFFVVRDTNPRQDRKSWMLWEEDGKYPNFIVEVLSDSTAQVDRTTKKKLYQDIWRVPEYFWFDPFSLEFEGFSLVNGTYQAIAKDGNGRCWSQQLDLYLGLHNDQLRYFSQNGELIPTPEEAAEEAGQQAEIAKAEVETFKAELSVAEEEAQAARAEAEALRQKLRSLGVDPEA